MLPIPFHLYINLYALLLTFCHESQKLHRTVSYFKFLCHNLSLLILSYLVKRLHKIITHKYTTGIDVSSDIDGAVFFKEGYCYWYDLNKHEFHCRCSDFDMNTFNEATLFRGDTIMITDDSTTKNTKQKIFLLNPNRSSGKASCNFLKTDWD